MNGFIHDEYINPRLHTDSLPSSCSPRSDRPRSPTPPSDRRRPAIVSTATAWTGRLADSWSPPTLVAGLPFARDRPQRSEALPTMLPDERRQQVPTMDILHRYNTDQAAVDLAFQSSRSHRSHWAAMRRLHCFPETRQDWAFWSNGRRKTYCWGVPSDAKKNY